MKPPVAMIAALPREVSALVKGWKSESLPGNRFIYSNGHSVVACAGMGGARAALAVQLAMAMRVTELISVGLAGACDRGLRVGDVVRAGVVIDRKTGERFVDAQFERVLVTTDAISSVGDKTQLRAAYGASAVDMEAATVARLARAHGLKFRAIKAISDEADFEVAGLSRFTTEDGQFREGAFGLHAAMRPAMWGKLRALARNSSKALAALTEAMRAELD
jgi:adenosylhomocysteine nucleosidase